MMAEWISVKDRLPEKKPIMIATTAYQNSSDFVIVYIDNVTWPYRRKIVTLGRYDYDCEDWKIKNAYRGIVTHWMPLPEPPKEET